MIVSCVSSSQGTNLHHSTAVGEIDGRVVPLSDLGPLAVPGDVDGGAALRGDTFQSEGTVDVGNGVVIHTVVIETAECYLGTNVCSEWRERERGGERGRKGGSRQGEKGDSLAV